MQQSALQLLSDAYNRFSETGERICSISFAKSTPEEKRDAYNALDFLKECGYIDYSARAVGFCSFKLTISGIKFIENGYREPATVPVIQGNNSIYIHGSGNTVSDNYNQLSADISHADISDEHKQLIESLLYEIKNPHLSQEKKSDKVKSFLFDISSGTISNAAASSLTVLLSSFFNTMT